MRTSKTIIACILLMSNIAFAGNNNDKYEKLKELYDAGKYEDCAYKAENFTFKDEMRKDSEPYLFISMCYFQLSMLSSKADEYPKAFDDAFKFAAKATKYDETGEVYKSYNEYFAELQEAGIKEAKSFFNSGNYSKASKYLDKVLSFNPSDNHIRLTKGICDILSRNEGEGGMELKTAFSQLDFKTKTSSENSEKLLTEAFIKYSEYLNDSQMKDSAEATIDIAKVILPESTKLKTLN